MLLSCRRSALIGSWPLTSGTTARISQPRAAGEEMIAKADAIRIETGAGMATGTVVLLEAERASIVATGTGTDTVAVEGIAMSGVIQTASGMRSGRGLTTALGRAAALIVTTTSEDGERSDARQPAAIGDRHHSSRSRGVVSGGDEGAWIIWAQASGTTLRRAASLITRF